MAYWVFNGKNGLKGVEGTYRASDTCNGGMVYIPDPVNPLVLTDAQIINALEKSRRARADFNRIFPTLLPEEQARLTKLLEDNPRLFTLNMDDNTYYDRIQAHDVKSIPVRTCGPRGGIGFGRQ